MRQSIKINIPSSSLPNEPVTKPKNINVFLIPVELWNNMLHQIILLIPTYLPTNYPSNYTPMQL